MKKMRILFKNNKKKNQATYFAYYYYWYALYAHISKPSSLISSSSSVASSSVQKTEALCPHTNKFFATNIICMYDVFLWNNNKRIWNVRKEFLSALKSYENTCFVYVELVGTTNRQRRKREDMMREHLRSYTCTKV